MSCSSWERVERWRKRWSRDDRSLPFWFWTNQDQWLMDGWNFWFGKIGTHMVVWTCNRLKRSLFSRVRFKETKLSYCKTSTVIWWLIIIIKMSLNEYNNYNFQEFSIRIGGMSTNDKSMYLQIMCISIQQLAKHAIEIPGNLGPMYIKERHPVLFTYGNRPLFVSYNSRMNCVWSLALYGDSFNNSSSLQSNRMITHGIG